MRAWLATMPRAVSCSSSPSMSQPVTEAQQAGPLLPRLRRTPRAGTCTGSQVPSQQHGPYGLDRGRDVGHPAVEAVQVTRQIGFVGSRPVVVGFARVDLKPERHRVQRSRLVAGNSRPLTCMARFSRPKRADARREPSAKRSPTPSRAPISSICPQQGIGVAEAQPVRDARLHRPRDRAAGRDRVQAELVAARARLQDLVRIVDADQRPSANALSYSTRAERPSLSVMIRSQPIEQDAQLSRTAARSSAPAWSSRCRSCDPAARTAR